MPGPKKAALTSASLSIRDVADLHAGRGVQRARARGDGVAPIWQDGNALPLDEVWNNRIQGNPPIEDPATGILIDNAKSWLTDQSWRWSWRVP